MEEYKSGDKEKHQKITIVILKMVRVLEDKN